MSSDEGIHIGVLMGQTAMQLADLGIAPAEVVRQSQVAQRRGLPRTARVLTGIAQTMSWAQVVERMTVSDGGTL